MLIVSLIRFARKEVSPISPLWRRKTTGPDPAAQTDALTTSTDGVRGQDLGIPPPDVRDWDERVAEMDAAETDGFTPGAMTLEHPDELVPYIDVDPSPLPGYDWTVGLYDEVRFFIDDDTLSELEDADPLEARFAAEPGITAVMREDREVVHVAARTMTAAQVHEVAVRVVADVAYATERMQQAREETEDGSAGE